VTGQNCDFTSHLAKADNEDLSRIKSEIATLNKIAKFSNRIANTPKIATQIESGFEFAHH